MNDDRPDPTTGKPFDLPHEAQTSSFYDPLSWTSDDPSRLVLGQPGRSTTHVDDTE
jgi:hypothetical protein